MSLEIYPIELVISGGIFAASNQQTERGLVNAKLECYQSRADLILFKLIRLHQAIISPNRMARHSV